MENTKSIAAAALVLTLAACGGGGSGGFVPAPAPAPSAEAPAPAPAPVAEAPAPAPVPGPNGELVPAPAPAPAPAPEPAPVVKTWKDADCARVGGVFLPACSINFSDNLAIVNPTVESGAAAISLSTNAAPVLAATPSKANGVKGNKAVLGLNLLHKVKLADYPGISFEAKLGTTDSTKVGDLYVTTTVSLSCDGSNWVNLVTAVRDMGATPTTDGYARYVATPALVQWYKTGVKSLPETGEALLYGQNGTGEAHSLDALKGAYPEACIWNFPNPNDPAAVAAGEPMGTTPALAINLGESSTLSAKSAWLRAVMIGDKPVF